MKVLGIKGTAQRTLDCALLMREKNPGNGNFPRIIGEVFLEAGCYEQAERYFLKAEKLSPQSPLPNMCLSQMYSELSEFSETPENSYAWLHACLAKEKAPKVGRRDIHKKMTDLVNHLNPEFAPEKVRHHKAATLNNAGVDFLAEGRYEEAEKAFQEAVMHAPELPYLDYNLSILYRETAAFSETSGNLYKAQSYAYKGKLKGDKNPDDVMGREMKGVFQKAESTGVLNKRGDIFEGSAVPAGGSIEVVIYPLENSCDS